MNRSGSLQPLRLLVLVMIAASWPRLVLAQPAEPPVMTALRLSDADRIVLDGHLTEEAWLRAMPAAGFRQQDPNTGDAATEPTEVPVLYDARRILIGVICFDSEPSRIMGNQMQRAQSIGADDRFMMAIDTYSNGRSGYYFEINPSGAMGDGLVLAGAGSGNGNAAGVNRSWDGIRLARVSRDERGWSAEIEIPFNTINFKPDAPSWGIRRRCRHSIARDLSRS